MRNKKNVINTIPPTPDYPFGRIKDDTGINDGTPICEENNGDIQETVTALMQRAKIEPNELPDNVSNGYQIFDAINEVGGKHDVIYPVTQSTDKLTIMVRLDNMVNGEFIVLDGEAVNTTDAKKINTLDLVISDVGMLKKGDIILLEKVNDQTFKGVVSFGAERMKGALICVEKGTQSADEGASNGVVFINHPEVDVAKTRIIYTPRRLNPRSSYVNTDFSCLLLDRTQFGFRIVYGNFPIEANDMLVIDWWIVEA